MPLRALFRGALLALSVAIATAAQATGIVPLSGTQQFDKDASPPAYLTGGQLYVYQAGTTTPATVYSDFALTTPLSVPITLNTAGRIPPIYGADGSVRLRLLSSASVLQFDDDNVALVTAAVSTTPISVTPQQLWSTGDVKTRYDDQPADGYVRANGRTIGSATSGASERANADCEALFKFLWGFSNISVVAGKGGSAAADWSSNKQLTLPDMAGRLIGARDDLGAGARSRITAATITGPTVIGAAGGAETVTLDGGMIPAHAHAIGAPTDPGHKHLLFNSDNLVGGSAPTSANQISKQNVFSSASDYSMGGSATAATIGLSATAFTGITNPANTGSAGGGLAHNNMPPVMLFTVYLKL